MYNFYLTNSSARGVATLLPYTHESHDTSPMRMETLLVRKWMCNGVLTIN